MKKNNRTYRASEMGLRSAPETTVSVAIGGVILTSTLGALGKELHTRKLTNELPSAVMVGDVKHGAFPVIKANNIDGAIALSAWAGYPVRVGDGISFSTQHMASKTLVALRDIGANLDDLSREWMLGESHEDRRARLAEEAAVRLAAAQSPSQPSPAPLCDDSPF